MKNIYLVGFMGTGKTAVGEILDRDLSEDFIEMDAMIAEREGMSVVDIFATKGEAYFRQCEQALLSELASQEGLVVSCGGGLMCRQENIKILRESGTVILLTAAKEVIYARIKTDEHRPLLNVDNPLEKIKTLLEERMPYYQQAHHIIATDILTPSQVVGQIKKRLDNG